MSHAAVVPFVASTPIRKGIREGEGRVREGRGREEGKRGERRGERSIEEASHESCWRSSVCSLNSYS